LAKKNKIVILQKPKLCCWRRYTNKNDPQSFGGGDGIHQLKKKQRNNFGNGGAC
jgi:hypothetical protein